MAILIDPPIWPAHGTTFAHLVSDTSLAELHDFAERAGLSDRAFDTDHYDVPAHRYEDLIALGARPISGQELIRRLRASGLRVPARDRPEALRRTLTFRWQQVADRAGLAEPLPAQQVEANMSGSPDPASMAGPPDPASMAGPPDRASMAEPPDPAGISSQQAAARERIWGAWRPQFAPDRESARELQKQNEERLLGRRVETVGADLINRWAQPHRHYHDLRHLRDVLVALDRLCEPEPPPVEVVLAAWFHDAVYGGKPGADEEASAVLARSHLTARDLAVGTVEEVARLVLLTRTHSPEPGDDNGALLCDADLAVLARDEPGYRRYTEDVRAEYAHVPEPDFIKGRTAVVRHLLDLDPLYRTARGRQLWQDRARANLHAELATLTRP